MDMYTGRDNLTRDEAVALVGEDAVDRVENEDCDYTGRVSADLDCNNATEFSASVVIPATEDREKRTLTVYYYQDRGRADETEDLGDLDWVPGHYTVY